MKSGWLHAKWKLLSVIKRKKPREFPFKTLCVWLNVAVIWKVAFFMAPLTFCTTSVSAAHLPHPCALSLSHLTAQPPTPPHPTSHHPAPSRPVLLPPSISLTICFSGETVLLFVVVSWTSRSQHSQERSPSHRSSSNGDADTGWPTSGCI